jgi:HipA-like protein
MKELLVSIERGGERIPVGFIRGEGSADARFAYSDTWLRDPASAPISLSLPLQEAPFTSAQTKAYFDGLLPEGFTRSTVARWMHVDDGDYLSILHGLGRECLGALCITEEGEDPQASYEKITREQVRELAAEAGVNPNTMQRALGQLESEGLVITNRTAGRTVTEDVAVLDVIRKRLAAELKEKFFSDMKELGYSRAQAAEIAAAETEEET